MKRGQIWWARLDLPSGRRPVVLVSRDTSYASRHVVTVAELSTVIRGISSEVTLGKNDGMPRPCVINTDNLSTIPKGLLESPIVVLSPRKLDELDTALRYSLGLSNHASRAVDRTIEEATAAYYQSVRGAAKAEDEALARASTRAAKRISY